MCFYQGKHRVDTSWPDTLTLDEIREFVIDIRGRRPIIHIGGGEPFMRADLLDIIREIKKNRLRCMVTTNGSLMNGPIIKRLTGSGLDVLIVSLYGPESIHDEIAGVRGAYKKTSENLKQFLRQRGKRTRVLVSSIILPENISVFTSFLADLQSLGIDGVKIEHLNYLTRKEFDEAAGSDEKEGFNLCPSVFVTKEVFSEKFVTDLMRLHEEIRREFRHVHIKPYLRPKQLRLWYRGLPRRDRNCGFIRHSVFINHNGDILPCQFFADCALGNIKKDPLEAVWLSERYQRLRKAISANRLPVCMRCCKN